MTPRAAERATTEVLVFEVGGQQAKRPKTNVAPAGI
jgi:hypothetical protein